MTKGLYTTDERRDVKYFNTAYARIPKQYFLLNYLYIYKLINIGLWYNKNDMYVFTYKYSNNDLII